MRSFVTISLLAALASTQTIVPSSVPLATRQAWCTSQKASCPLLCSQTNKGSTSYTSNTCDATTLDWTCVCTNGITPNASQYSQTIPYFECTEYNTQCVSNCGGVSSCQAACRQDHPCGAQDPTRVNSSSISPTASKSGSGSSGSAAATTTGFGSFGGAGNGGSQATSTGKSSSAGVRTTAINVGQTYGFAVVCAGIFAGFGLML